MVIDGQALLPFELHGPPRPFAWFLSHRGCHRATQQVPALSDKETFVRPLEYLLRHLGGGEQHKAFFDQDERAESMRPGQPGADEIAAGLYGSRWGVVVLSPEFFTSKWCVRELLTY